jgi:hypothetical protein
VLFSLYLTDLIGFLGNQELYYVSFLCMSKLANLCVGILLAKETKYRREKKNINKPTTYIVSLSLFSSACAQQHSIAKGKNKLLMMIIEPWH